MSIDDVAKANFEELKNYVRARTEAGTKSAEDVINWLWLTVEEAENAGRDDVVAKLRAIAQAVFNIPSSGC